MTLLDYPIPGVLPELCAAYEADPTHTDLLGVMADSADESGRPLVAEALRWLWERGRVPILYPDIRPDNREWWALGWGDDGYSKLNRPFDLPRDMWGAMQGRREGDTATQAIRRVTDRWEGATEAERQKWRKWRPRPADGQAGTE